MQFHWAQSLMNEIQLKNIYDTLLVAAYIWMRDETSYKRSQNKPEYKESSWRAGNEWCVLGWAFRHRASYVVG